MFKLDRGQVYSLWDNPILSLLHKDYDRKGSSAKKKSLVAILNILDAETSWLATKYLKAVGISTLEREKYSNESRQTSSKK